MEATLQMLLTTLKQQQDQINDFMQQTKGQVAQIESNMQE